MSWWPFSKTATQPALRSSSSHSSATNQSTLSGRDYSKADNDPMHELRVKARRRLIGAVVVALLAVVLLPMLMDNQPPQSLEPAIDIQIPNPDKTLFQPKGLPILPHEPVVEATPAEPTSAELGAVESKPVELKTVEVRTIETKVVEKKALTVKDSAKNTDIADTTLTALQVAAMGNEAAADTLAEKIRAKGYKVSVQAFPTKEGKTKYRVRLGPYPSRDKTEQVQTKLAKDGFESRLVHP